MTLMIRKQIYIRSDQQKLLTVRARQEGRTEAEIIRQAIDMLLVDRDLISQPRGAKSRRGLESILKTARSLHAMGEMPNRRRKWSRDEIYEERMEKILKHHGGYSR
jgi:hypothetical protein